MAQQKMVGGSQRSEAFATPRRVAAGRVTQYRRAERLVQRYPPRDPIAQRRLNERRVVGESISRVSSRPPAGILQGLRKIPVVERDDRLDPVRRQLVDQPVVELQAGWINRSTALRLHSGPRY
jgi:hypothetical protein